MTEAYPVCRPNIGPRERRRRLRFGIVSLALAVGLAIGLGVVDASRGWRLLLFVPFLSAAMGFLQFREKT